MKLDKEYKGKFISDNYMLIIVIKVI